MKCMCLCAERCRCRYQYVPLFLWSWCTVPTAEMLHEMHVLVCRALQMQISVRAAFFHRWCTVPTAEGGTFCSHTAHEKKKKELHRQWKNESPHCLKYTSHVGAEYRKNSRTCKHVYVRLVAYGCVGYYTTPAPASMCVRLSCYVRMCGGHIVCDSICSELALI